MGLSHSNDVGGGRLRRGAARDQCAWRRPAARTRGTAGAAGRRTRGRRGGGRGGVAPALFTAADSNKDGSVTREELKATFDSWFTAADTE